MKKHTKIYLKAFGLDTGDPTQFIPSEWGGKKAVDIHHIISRGKGGEDRIENLMALTRREHEELGDRASLIWNLLSTHRYYLKQHNVPFDNEWFEEKMAHYAHVNVNSE